MEDNAECMLVPIDAHVRALEEIGGVPHLPCLPIVERWILGRLRDRILYSLVEVDAAIPDLMTHLNEARPIRR